jgi:hypothetical protein
VADALVAHRRYFQQGLELLTELEPHTHHVLTMSRQVCVCVCVRLCWLPLGQRHRESGAGCLQRCVCAALLAPTGPETQREWCWLLAAAEGGHHGSRCAALIPDTLRLRLRQLPAAQGSSTTVSRSDIRLRQHLDSPAHGLVRR